MAFEDYDSEGYPISELSRNHSRKAYSVPDYDIRSLDEIEHCLNKSKYSERFTCAEHIAYLENLQKGLSMIRVAEEREGIMNWEIREVLERVKKLIIRLSATSDSFLGSRVYDAKTSQRQDNLETNPAAKTHLTASYSEPLM